MAQAKKVYMLDELVGDIRQVLFAIKDPRTQAQKVAEHLSELLSMPASLEGKLNPPSENAPSVQHLHLDKDHGHPGPGFLVMSSTLAPGWRNAPHDHGTIWVVYGVYRGAIQQTKYSWVYRQGEWTSPELKEILSFKQEPGDVAFFLPGEIHDTANASEDRSIVIRIESRSLEGHWRHTYDVESNSAAAFTSAAPLPASR